MHDSAPLQLTPSPQPRAEPAHTALASHTSDTVQKRPSSQLAPALAVHAVADVAGAHTWHCCAGLRVPAAKQTPPITQPSHAVTHASALGSQSCPAAQVVAPATQRSVASLQVSAPLQPTPSPQKSAELPAHRPPPQTSPRVQKRPSSQLAPSFVLHAARDRATSQISHSLAGLRAPPA